MLRPHMYQIINKNDNYYEFVVAVAKEPGILPMPPRKITSL